ncbi:MAG TPA: ATP-binding protein, partial [Actinomycetota bacterium]|nr:ATP-binding protein [Actinomycetota bacterium]
GTEGLAGIPPVMPAEAGAKRMRPLLEVRRSATRGYCDEVGLAYDDDPANSDDRFDRSAIRSTVVAPIEARWGEGAVAAMATSAERLSDDAEALKGLAITLYNELARGEGGEVHFERPGLNPLPRALRRRLLERAVGRVRDRSGGIEAALDALEKSDGEVRHFDAASGTTIEITRDEVVVQRPATEQ